MFQSNDLHGDQSVGSMGGQGGFPGGMQSLPSQGNAHAIIRAPLIYSNGHSRRSADYCVFYFRRQRSGRQELRGDQTATLALVPTALRQVPAERTGVLIKGTVQIWKAALASHIALCEPTM